MKIKHVLPGLVMALSILNASAHLGQAVSSDGKVTATLETSTEVNGVITYTIGVETKDSASGPVTGKSEVTVVATPTADGGYEIATTTKEIDPTTGTTTSSATTTETASSYVPPATALQAIIPPTESGGDPLSH